MKMQFWIDLNINLKILGYKLNIIKKIINDFPKRKFILVGDSGEKDPEVYAAATKLFPKNIIKVCIRDMGNIAKNSKRYKDIVSTVGKERFILFKSGKDLKKIKM